LSSYLCRVVSGTPNIREADECRTIAWFSPDDVPVELTEITPVNGRTT
jgi:hypothetical protein